MKTDYDPITRISVLARTMAKELMGKMEFRTERDVNSYFWTYDPEKKIWINDADLIIRDYIVKKDKGAYADLKESVKGDIIRYIKDKSFIPPERFQSQDGVIAFKNCVLDAKNGYKKIEDKPECYLKSRIPVNYNPKATCPEFLKFINSSIPEIEDRINLFECLAMIFIPHINFEKAVMFIGVAASGKSTIFKLLREIVGQHNTVSLSIQDILENRFAAERLVNKKLNVYADMSNKTIKDFNRFKMIISGDQITVEPKGKQSYEIVPEAKHFFSTNNLPELNEDHDAVWRRFQIVDFPISFAEKKDLGLYARLTTEKELEGIVNLLLKTAKNMVRNGHLKYEQELSDVRMRWMLQSNAVHEMIEKSGLVKKQSDQRIDHKRFYELYIRFCKSKRYTIKTQRTVALQIQKLGFESQKSSSQRYWLGLQEITTKDGQSVL